MMKIRVHIHLRTLTALATVSVSDVKVVAFCTVVPDSTVISEKVEINSV